MPQQHLGAGLRALDRRVPVEAAQAARALPQPLVRRRVGLQAHDLVRRRGVLEHGVELPARVALERERPGRVEHDRQEVLEGRRDVGVGLWYSPAWKIRPPPASTNSRSAARNASPSAGSGEIA